MKKTLIVEGEFIENLFITQAENVTRKDLYNFITQDYSEYDLICDFEQYADFEKAILDNPIWESIIDKTDKIEYKPSLDIKFICENYNNINHSVFLINSDKNNIEDLMDNYGFLFIEYDNLETTWETFQNVRKGIHLKVTKSKILPTELKLDYWAKLENYLTPMSGFILFDKYILNDSTNQKLEKNLFPLLELVLKNNGINNPINITIVAEPKENGYCIKERHSSINKFLISKGLKNFKLNIIKHYKVFYPRDFEGLHSRFILTNYFHYKCDDSFNFFKNNGKVNNDADIRIGFSLDSGNDSFYKKELNDLKIYFSKIENNPKSPKKEYQTMFYPDKCNILLD